MTQTNQETNAKTIDVINDAIVKADGTKVLTAIQQMELRFGSLKKQLIEKLKGTQLNLESKHEVGTDFSYAYYHITGSLKNSTLSPNNCVDLKYYPHNRHGVTKNGKVFKNFESFLTHLTAIVKAELYTELTFLEAMDYLYKGKETIFYKKYDYHSLSPIYPDQFSLEEILDSDLTFYKSNKVITLDGIEFSNADEAIDYIANYFKD